MKRIVGFAGALTLAIVASTHTNVLGAYAFGIDGVGGIKAPIRNSGPQVQSSKIGVYEKRSSLLEKSKPLLLAQSVADNSVQVNQLQERVRKLNGEVEELTFQLLQLQEQIRKMQEDNEFRFQELEENHSDSSGGNNKNSNLASKSISGGSRLGKSQPSEAAQLSTLSGGKNTSKTIMEAGRILGIPPRSLGTLKFDANGNVIESAVGKPLDLTSLSRPSDVQGNSNGDVSNLKPGLLIARGRDYFDAGDYVSAEQTLHQMIKSYPENSARPEAQYWIGRSLFARSKFHAAATIFLDTHNAYPDAIRAPDTLLRLGLSMAGLNHREIACATYAEVGKQFPNADTSVKAQVTIEQKSAKC
jgi:tol-pal system protein YbgF